MVGACPRCGTDPGFEWAICPGCGMREDGPKAAHDEHRWTPTIVERAAPSGPARARFAQGEGDFYQPITPGEARLPLGFGTEAADKTVIQSGYDRASDDRADHTIIESQHPIADVIPSDSTVIVRGGKRGVTGPLAYFVKRNGIRAGSITLVRDGMTMGRAADQDMVFSNETVSKRHAKLKSEDSHFVYWDLASSNGSFLLQPDGSRRRIFEPVVLTDGDSLFLGDARVTFIEVECERSV